MRRRTLLGAAPLVPLLAVVGCQAGGTSSNDSSKTDTVKEPQFALLFQNTLGGHRVDGSGEGQVLLLGASGNVLQKFPFLPIDQPGLVEHDGVLSWVGDDGAYIWSDELQTAATWATDGFISPRSSLTSISAADGGFLIAIDGGAPSPDRYVSGLALIAKDQQPQVWSHDGWLGGGVTWVDERAVGFSSSTLFDPMITLTDLTTAPDGEKLAAPIDGSSVFGRLVADGKRVLVLHAPKMSGQVAHLWTHNVENGSTDLIPLSGDGAHLDVASRYSDSLPGDTILLEGSLYWLQGSKLWRADAQTGESVVITDAGSDRHSTLFLTHNGLISVGRSKKEWSIECRDLASGEAVVAIGDIRVEGPKDMLPLGAVRLLG